MGKSLSFLQGGFEFRYPISFFGFDITPVFGFEFRSRFSVFDLTPVFDFEFAFRSRFSVSIFDPVFDFDFVFSISILGSEFRFGSSVSISTFNFGFEFGSDFRLRDRFRLSPSGVLTSVGGGSSWGVAWWPESARKFLGCLPLVQSPVTRSPASSGLAVIFEFEFEDLPQWGKIPP